jgi:hypothetical protein
VQDSVEVWDAFLSWLHCTVLHTVQPQQVHEDQFRPQLSRRTCL